MPSLLQEGLSFIELNCTSVIGELQNRFFLNSIQRTKTASDPLDINCP